jgi:hypothetical protein
LTTWSEGSSQRRTQLIKPTLLPTIGRRYVEAELQRRGYVVESTSRFGIEVTDRRGARSCSIQVRTRQNLGSRDGWVLKSKHASIKSDSFFYCMVDFGSAGDARTVYVVPSPVVADALTASHQRWLATPGKKGLAHTDHEMRKLLQDYGGIFRPDNPYPAGWLEQYRDAWHLLGLEPASIAALARPGT